MVISSSYRQFHKIDVGTDEPSRTQVQAELMKPNQMADQSDVCLSLKVNLTVEKLC